MPRSFLLAFLLAGGSVLSFPSVCGPARAQSAQALPFVSPVFTDNMVLQRDRPIKIWGWTLPGETVTVSLSGKSAAAKADSAGKWLAVLPALKVSAVPVTLSVSGGGKNASLTNILLGDVWICSGQSNMEMGIGAAKDAAQEIASANYPLIRLYTVPKKTAYAKEPLTHGKWEVCTPQTVSTGGWGGFSAVGYYFGRKLNQELNIPIGLIHTSWGGTVAEAWVSGESLSAINDFRETVRQVETTAKEGDRDFEAQMKAWWKQTDAGAAKGFEASDYAASGWSTMKLPTLWENAGLPDFDGIVYFRKEIELPDTAAGKEAVLNLGTIDDRDSTSVNGHWVGMMNAYNDNRVYKIPAGVLKAGKNVISVSVLDTGGGGGIYGTPEAMHLEVDSKTYPLSGDWNYLKGAALTSLKPAPLQSADNPNIPTVLYNGMVSPLVPLGIKGAIWYQGESNSGRAAQYQKLLPTLIGDWRRQFESGEFPFYIVQLASFMGRDTEPKNDPWPLLREAQELTATQVKNSGLAVAIDIGEADDIHPKNKQEVGRRLALNALAKTYGKRMAFSGPVYKAMHTENGSVVLRFEHTEGGLKAADNSAPKGFAVAGEDKHFYWADAKIVGDTVVVSSASVPKPVAVRYAWGNNPDATLYNGAGLPAVPFRTDRP